MSLPHAPPEETGHPASSPAPGAAAAVDETTSTTLGLSKWFETEVSPHESGLRAYLHRSLPCSADVDDVGVDDEREDAAPVKAPKNKKAPSLPHRASAPTEPRTPQKRAPAKKAAAPRKAAPKRPSGPRTAAGKRAPARKSPRPRST